ncbi:MAG: FAD-binding oxidoreductase [Thermoplasmata archaeon]|nr:FAD-binding oxidoreductase [Thermoplasmata archaeon]
MSGEPRDRYAVVIVGGGIVGLFTAYHLARAGTGPIAVFERGFLSSGASGRNGGGVRQQWETGATVALAREAVAAWRRFPGEFGFNPYFRQGGYLFLAESAAELAQLDRVAATVRAAGLPLERLDPRAVARRAPGIRTDRIQGASYLGSDGTLYPFPAIWGAYEAARRLGVDVFLRSEVTAIDSEGGRVLGVRVGGRRVAADRVVNAAGGWSGELSRRAGLSVPNVASRHEILATEPMKRFLDPMLIRLSDGLYVSQTMRGELVGGLSVPHPPGVVPGPPSSIAFLRRMSASLVDLFPNLSGLNVLRAWAGYYDDTPDGMPVIGEDPRLRGFFHANGFGGHGFMLSPATSLRVARSVLGERTDLDPARFGPARFLSPGRAMHAEHLQPG